VSYASRRLDRIADVIGVDAVNEIIADLEAEEKKSLGQKNWDAFASGSLTGTSTLREEGQ